MIREELRLIRKYKTPDINFSSNLYKCFPVSSFIFIAKLNFGPHVWYVDSQSPSEPIEYFIFADKYCSQIKKDCQIRYSNNMNEFN